MTATPAPFPRKGAKCVVNARAPCLVGSRGVIVGEENEIGMWPVTVPTFCLQWYTATEIEEDVDAPTPT